MTTVLLSVAWSIPLVMKSEPVIKEIFTTTKMHAIKASIIYFINFQAVSSSKDSMKTGLCVLL